MQRKIRKIFVVVIVLVVISLSLFFGNFFDLEISAESFEKNYFAHNRFLTERNFYRLQEIKQNLSQKQKNIISSKAKLSEQIFLLLQEQESLHAVSGDQENPKKADFLMEDQGTAINDLKKKLLSLVALENFYSMLISSIDRRSSDAENKTFVFEGWYRDRISDQKNTFPFLWPVIPSLGISAGFEDEKYKKRFRVPHLGIDIQTDASYPVRSIADGKVIEIQEKESLTFIKIAHENDFSSLYGHIVQMKVREGDLVKKGQVIASTGGVPGTFGSVGTSTGQHLHFALFQKDIPLDPLYFLDITLVPLEKIPQNFDFEKYFSGMAFADYDGDGLSNIYEFAFSKNMYRSEKWGEKTENQKKEGIDFVFSDFLKTDQKEGF